ncbi:TNFAIP3-interacting protein 1 isoform X1 [Megalops cyprinoides]|uniref:TNFAIP3-interacting protein 1 isoform X1 n=1 Tax=Megalops cyprinoides TaxID=118141 RepID=UPI0018647E2B|nr:TNFAIP3-interacting protein 1 isoform X1 [Megalops cyprinoides]XP_036404747.1 TNFAIP3-interacting protein 1 isoform X1 [Megalops cyprinoides]XP_036404748.1 TNFAIP3-interacting protein 1 isoform X1 [Megalops cyprinoides]
MEGKGPFRIYDPGGSEALAKEEAGSATYRQLVEENSVLRERMKGLKSLGDLLEESQLEASKLRQRVEELVRDNETLRSSTASSSPSLCAGLPVQADVQAQAKPPGLSSANLTESQECVEGRALQPESSEGSSEFEVVNMDDKSGDSKLGGMLQLPQETLELASQLQRLESSFSLFSEESNPNQLLAHLGRMAVEFNRLSSKVQKNEQRTSLLQTLCEQLRQENNELRKKMEEDLQLRNQDLELLRQENLKLKRLVTGTDEPTAGSPQQEVKEEVVKLEPTGAKMEAAVAQQCCFPFIQSCKTAEKTVLKACDPEVYEKKIKLLEKQRKDVLEVNKQWDIQWNSMKLQFEQKITDLRQRLADSQKAVGELEAEREQRQRDYDKKLLLAKSKIENLQGEKELLTAETCELKQKMRYLQDQLLPLSKQREYQEKEIQRLNRALEEALNLHSPTNAQQSQFGNHGEGSGGARRQELLTQIAVLKEQVKIFEEDFQKERSDRERMNEEKEDLRRQVDRLQSQMTNLTTQLHQTQSECQRERTERCKLERLHMHLKQGQHERRTSDPTSSSNNGPLSPPYCGPFVPPAPQAPQGFEAWPVHFPPRMPNLGATHGRDFQPLQPGFPWQSSFPQPRGMRGPGEAARPPPENTDPSAAGFGKRDRQNDPGKH